MYDPAIENAGHPDQHYPMKPSFNQDANGFPKFFLSICVRYYTGSDMSLIELDTDAAAMLSNVALSVFVTLSLALAPPSRRDA